MKSTNPLLSVAVPPTPTSNCVATPPPGAASLKLSNGGGVNKEQEANGSSSRRRRIKHKPVVPVVSREARFSTGITSVTTVPSLKQPAASLSLSPVMTVTHEPEIEQVPSPPRVEPTFLGIVLATNLPLLLSTTESSSSSSSQAESHSSSPIVQRVPRPLVRMYNNNWTPLIQELATLVTLDVLRVTFVRGTFQVWIKRTLLRTWKRWARQQQHGALIGMPSYVRHQSQTSQRLLPPSTTQMVRGIPNYGQTCFLNSVLQALASLVPFCTYLERIVHLQHQQEQYLNEAVMEESSSASLSELVLHLFHGLSSEQQDRLMMDPRDILKRVARQHAQFRPRHRHGLVGREQQDAQELLQALLDMVISDAQFSNGASSSLESSILSSREGDELLSLSAFLVKMDEEQKSVADGSLPSLDSSDVSSFETALTSAVNSEEEEESLTQPHADCNGHDPNGELLHPEEKKQEDYEHQHARETRQSAKTTTETVASSSVDEPSTPPSLDVASNNTSTEESSEPSPLSASTVLMLQTLSPIMPSPLSGWLGSTLQCCTCHHVRPIQNAPFLDIPIVPTSVSSYLTTGQKARPALRLPACTLAQCLDEFTSVERVHDVECRNCTLLKDIRQLEEEVFMLKGAIKTVLSRKNCGNDQVEGLQHELARAELKLDIYKKMDPDADDNELQSMAASLDELDFVGPPRKRPLVRGQAKKCLLLTRLPNVLCLHVQRRYYDPVTDGMAKTMQHVDFPEILDLSPYCAYGGGKEGMPSWAGRGEGSSFMSSSGKLLSNGKLYKLMSVIEHRGNAFSGHYQTYRRVGNGDAWVVVSDQSVSPIHWRDVRKCQAYMLFYESM